MLCGCWWDIWKNGKPVTVGLAVEGHLIGEMASAVFTFLALLLVPPQKRGERKEGQKETRFENAGRQRWEQVRREEEDFGDSPIFANLGSDPDSGSAPLWETAWC